MLCALVILIVLAAALTMAIGRQNRASQRLAESREATRLAERTLTTLQAGQPPPAPLEGAIIEIAPLHAASEVPGCTWVRIRVTNNGHAAGLVGLVRSTPSAGASP